MFDGFPGGAGLRDELFELGMERFQRRADLVGRLAGFVRQRFHFGCHNGKSFAGIAGTGGFDRRIQCQQIGLLGNGLDLVCNIGDILNIFLKTLCAGLDVVHRREGVVERVACL